MYASRTHTNGDQVRDALRGPGSIPAMWIAYLDSRQARPPSDSMGPETAPASASRLTTTALVCALCGLVLLAAGPVRADADPPGPMWGEGGVIDPAEPTAVAQPEELVDRMLEGSERGGLFHYTYTGAGSLMIETACGQWGHGDSIAYDLDFPGAPHVVACAQWGGVAKMACPVNHASTGFSLALRDHNGNTVANAWVMWIAVYPSEYEDPSSNLMIETGCGQWGHGDSIAYDLDFPGAPRVVSCAQYGWTPMMSCPVNHNSDGFSLALQDHDGQAVANAWVLWIAVYPSQVTLDSGLILETKLSSTWGDGDLVSYDVDFPGAPHAVTCAQYGWTPRITCPVDHSSSGFTLSSRTHDGSSSGDAWTFALAAYPSEYVGEPGPSICLDPPSLSNSCSVGQDAPDQTFEVWNCGEGTLDYTISTSEVGEWQPYGQRYAIIVMGGNVDPSSQHYTWYWGDTYGMFTELESYGLVADNIYFLSYGPSADAHPEAVDAVSTTENIYTAYQWAQQVCTDEDLLYIYWVDHGSPTAFDTNNGSITHAELGTLMESIVARRIIGAYNPCYSGAVIDDISAPGVITTTSQDAFHPNSWGWAGKWRQALRGGTEEDPTDTDGDGYISVTEAYLWICPKSQAAGEHPMYDDNGDAVGHECDEAGFDPNDPTKDGYNGTFYSLDGWLDASRDGRNRDVSWLACSPTEGESTGEHDAVAVVYETADLPAGSYSAAITVSAPGADNSPQTIPVSLTVDDCLVSDMNHDGFRSIVGDVPCFVECVYNGDCGCCETWCTCAGDCNGDGSLSVIGDMPCFVDCVYNGNCGSG